MNKELTATLFCETCDEERGRIHGVERGNGVLENVSDITDSKACAVCGTPFVTTRPEDGPLPKPKPKSEPEAGPVETIKEIAP